MNNDSRKAKSRYLQNIVKDKITTLFQLNPGDIRTSNTGENGEDVKLLTLTAVDFNKTISGGPPKDGIHAINEPTFSLVFELNQLDAEEPLLMLERGG